MRGCVCFFVRGGKILWQKCLSACKSFSTLCGMFGFGFLSDVVVTHLRHHYHAILHETFILPWQLPATVAVATSKMPYNQTTQHRRGTHRLIGSTASTAIYRNSGSICGLYRLFTFKFSVRSQTTNYVANIERHPILAGYGFRFLEK